MKSLSVKLQESSCVEVVKEKVPLTKSHVPRIPIYLSCLGLGDDGIDCDGLSHSVIMSAHPNMITNGVDIFTSLSSPPTPLPPLPLRTQG